IQRPGGQAVGAAGPTGAERKGVRLRGGVAWAGEGIDLATLPTADLSQDMGRGAEAIEADAPASTGELERAPADQAGAEKRSGGDRIVEAVEGKRKAGIGDHVGGKATVAAVAGEGRSIAEIFLVAGAVGTHAAGMTEPGDAHSLAQPQRSHAGCQGIDNADDFVAG